MLLGEHAVVDTTVVCEDERAQSRVLTLCRRQPRPGLALEPDVGIEAGLVTGMARGRGAATRLADIADIKRRLACGAHLFRQRLDEVECDGLAPIAVAADANHLVAGTVER